nr:hypothetical protein [Morchella crassipes]
MQTWDESPKFCKRRARGGGSPLFSFLYFFSPWGCRMGAVKVGQKISKWKFVERGGGVLHPLTKSREGSGGMRKGRGGGKVGGGGGRILCRKKAKENENVV